MIGFAVASILAIVGVAPHEVSSDSVGLGLLGFVFFFIAAACLYIAFLPRAQPETLSTHDSSL